MNEPRWYCLSREGMATLCTDKADAEMTAINADELYPRAGPHRAVQLVEAAPQPQQAAPAVEDLLVMAVECGVIRMSQVMSADLQDALVAFAKRLATTPPQQAPAPQQALTQAQRIRLWNNSPEYHGDVVGRDAFERLVKLVESVHRIGEPAPQRKALTNADVVEAWRTTEAARSDYGWTSCEWFQAGVRFAQRFYEITQPSQQERT